MKAGMVGVGICSVLCKLKNPRTHFRFNPFKTMVVVLIIRNHRFKFHEHGNCLHKAFQVVYELCSQLNSVYKVI